jgi:ubiquinone/menaquinone biosynthesis C-methylase UbiE
MSPLQPSMKVESSAADAISYHDSIAWRWTAAHGAGGFRARRSLLKGVLAQVVRRGDSWADIGCGSGVLTKDLVDLGAARVVGLDASAEMLGYARKSFEAPAGIQVQWVQGRVESLESIPSATFDGVLCSSVIEYVDSPEAVLREIARVLKPEGCFVLSVPPKRSVVRAIQKLVRQALRVAGRDVFSYLSVSKFEARRRTVAALFRDHGLAVSRVTGFDPVLPRFVHAVLQPSLLIVEGRKPAA